MSTLLEKIGHKYHHAKRTRCRDRGCAAVISSRKGHLILKGDNLDNNTGRMCDCIIFQNKRRIILVELKSKSIRASNITEKFEGSAKKSITIVSCFENVSEFEFILVLLAKDYPPSSSRIMRDQTVTIRGKKQSIMLGKCGCSIDSYM